MKITRVRFSNGDTSGFLLGTEYVGYQAVLNEISSIPELTVNKQGVVRSVIPFVILHYRETLLWCVIFRVVFLRGRGNILVWHFILAERDRLVKPLSC